MTKNKIVLKSSLVFWSIYMIIAGALFIIVPNKLIEILNMSTEHDNWPRLFGALSVIIGVCYIFISKSKMPKEIIIWTIFGRFFFASITIIAVIFNWFSPVILFVGAFDAINSFWTLIGFLQIKNTLPTF